MKIFEKIKGIIKEKGWTVVHLHNEIVSIFEENAVIYLTLHRTLNGKTKFRESTLHQVAAALSTTPKKLREDTDEQETSTRYDYNQNAFLEIETTNLKFLTAKLTLMGGAITTTEQDPIERGEFMKWIHGLQGEMVCVVATPQGPEQHTIKKGDSFYFNSTQPHHFENKTRKKAECILIQNPKYL
ncbi:MAG: cupin domain-containing protein [Candidatus Omnitrophica bacterium]|nr:cupin domain-containing protein [Candidatus Omnitrophota bacterium]